MAKVWIVFDALYLVLDDLAGLRFYAVVILFYHIAHPIHSGIIDKVGDDGDFAVRFGLGGDPLVIDHDLGVENLLLDALIEIVGDRSDEHPLRQIGNLRGRNKAVHLGRNGRRITLLADRGGLPPLQYLTETLRKGFGGVAHHLTGKDIADGVHHHGGLFVAVVAF